MTDDQSGLRPLCFVLMPFGKKDDENRRTIDFDRVYTEVIGPAVEAAGMDCIRADEEKVGGIIHKPMFERLLLCEYAVADLTAANANVFYELGIRHALRPHTTVLVSAQGSSLPFDLRPVRMMHTYQLDGAGTPAAAAADAEALAAQLRAAQERSVDSPVYQLLKSIDDWQPPDAAGVEAFHDQVARVEALHGRLRAAKDAADSEGAGAAKAQLVDVERALGPLGDTTLGLAVELLLAYRGVSAFDEMIALYRRLPAEFARLPMVRQQYALALNRSGRPGEAIDVLQRLIRERGPSSETCGILGRVHKDRWEAARKAGRTTQADGHLEQAIDTYLQGFEVDWRDYYPGINAVELMTLRDPADPRIAALLPVVRYSAQRAVAGSPDYWGCATMLELAILADDEQDARRWLRRALVVTHDGWMLSSTAESLRRILTAKQHAVTGPAWLPAIVDELSLAGTG